MPDYKEMYFALFRATEDAISHLIAAQQACEEMYLQSAEPEVKVLSFEGRHTAKDKEES